MPFRRRMPATRNSLTHKFEVAGHEGYLTVGMYEDGSPGELFITMAKEGSTVGGTMDAFGTAISLCLQYGVPVRELVPQVCPQPVSSRVVSPRIRIYRWRNRLWIISSAG
jgi:ribonucleoside-diphosphate reductase alpha chain